MLANRILQYNTVAFADGEDFWISKNVISSMLEVSTATVARVINRSFKDGEISHKLDRKKYAVKTLDGKKIYKYFYSMNVFYTILIYIRTQKARDYIKKMIDYGNNYLYQMYMNSIQSKSKDTDVFL